MIAGPPKTREHSSSSTGLAHTRPVAFSNLN